MMRFLAARLLTAMALVAGSFSLAMWAGPAEALPKKLERWTEVRSENFTFYSNAGKRPTEKIAKDLELLRKVLSELSPLPTNSPKPTFFYVFRSDSDFKPYKFLYQGKPAQIAGFFMSREHVNHIAIDASSADTASEIIYHEYIHYYLDNNFPRLPLWFNEGMAEFYSSFETEAKRANVGKPIIRHLRWLNSQPLIPLSELLAVDQSSATYNEGTRQGSFYAQSWALVHYLMVGNAERRTQTLRFLELVARNVPESEAFQTAFETDYKTFERELKTYTNKRLFEYLIYELEKWEADVGAARPLGAHEALTLLGELLVNQAPLRPEAAEHFQAALAAAPDYGPALAGLAHVAKRQQRHDEAGDLYGRAAASEDAPFATLYHAASHRLLSGSNVEESLPWLERCIALQPSFGPCWALLTLAYTHLDEPPESALEVGQKAHNMFPGRTDIAYNLVLLATRLGDRSTAQLLVDGYFANLPDPGERIGAETALMQMDLQRASELAQAKDLDGAEAILMELELRAAATPGAGMMAHVKQLKETIAYNRFVDRYNEAVSLLNKRRFTEAVALLEELVLEEEAPKHQIDGARQLLEDVKSQMGF